MCRYPVIAMAIMKWVEHCFSEKHYAKVITESVPLQIVLLDEVRDLTLSVVIEAT